METFKRAENFIYKNARPIDLARWQYHFENADKELVLSALSHYQNSDGGFGHALEPDFWNPNSSPIATWSAAEILREINLTDRNHPIIKGILRYLKNTKDFNGRFWRNSIASNNDFPHAQWWEYSSDSDFVLQYNPTAALVGFIIAFADENDELYITACDVARQATNYFIEQKKPQSMHLISCFITMHEQLSSIAGFDIIDKELLLARLKQQVKDAITTDISLWANSYICKPSQFFRSKNNVFYNESKDIADYECDFIIKNQLPNGSWNITWSWNDYKSEWEVSKRWWMGNLAILNMLYLRGMEKL